MSDSRTETVAPADRSAPPILRELTTARVAVAASVLIGLVAAGFALQSNGQDKLSLSLVFGALFGIVLQRARFCFFCNFRDWYDNGDTRGLLAILVALASGMAGYTLVFGGWLPDAFSGRLPPTAFIGPVSAVLVLAGFVFGIGVSLSGSCVSAHLYRLGEGSPTAPFSLIGTVLGFILGFATWNPLYVYAVSTAPTVWIPGHLGYVGGLAAGLSALAAVALLLGYRASNVRSAPVTDAWRAVLIERWPVWAGGLAIGALGTGAYLRVAPLGVTAEIAARARLTADAFGWLPERIEGLDTLRGCVAIMSESLLSPNGVFVMALIAGSFAAALPAGQFKPMWPTISQVVRGTLGGVLLGWGAMTGLGCTVGTLLSGIMAGALSGWVFAIAVFVGAASTLWLGRRARFLQ